MSRRGWLLFIAMSVIWGVTYAFIRIGVDAGVSPLFLTWFRLVIAAVVLLAIAIRIGTLGQVRGQLRWLLVFAVVELAVPQPLIAAGERHVSSSLTAIIIASSPLFISLLAVAVDVAEVPSRQALLGLVCGFAGVVVLVGVHVSGGSAEALGIAAIVFSAGCYALGPLIVGRHLRALDPCASMGASVTLGALLLSPTLSFSWPQRLPSAGAVAAMLALGLLCTALAFVAYSALIVEVGPRRALVITYINPVVALAVGLLFLHEHAGVSTAVGLPLILAGSWLATGGAIGRSEAREGDAYKLAGATESITAITDEGSGANELEGSRASARRPPGATAEK